MFGLKKDDQAAKGPSEEQIEQAKQFIRDLVREMHEATPEEAAALAQRVKDRCASDKLLPFGFKQKAYARIRELEGDANMRAADRLIHLAGNLAAQEMMGERAAKLGESRRYFSKACMLGAPEEWRTAYNRLTETVMLTGGVHHPGPTRAKPLNTAPETPNRAKA
jgi:hypothetical protein